MVKPLRNLQGANVKGGLGKGGNLRSENNSALGVLAGMEQP